MESENEVKYYFGIITVMLAFVIITGGFILVIIRYQKHLLNKQRERLKLDVRHKKDLLLASIQSAEAERMQLAKDIHDEIGSIFSTLSLSLNQLNGTNLVDSNHLQTSKNLIQSGINSVRRISHAIVPFELELLGLEQTLENHFETMSEVSGLEICFENSARLDALNDTATLAIYRIMQELCSNCLKHANAKKLDIKITGNDEETVLSYRDDGIGLNLLHKDAKKGIGLKNIESRILLLNGRVSFTSEHQQGFACDIHIPLKNNGNL